MQVTKKLTRQGGSLMVTLPKAWLDQFGEVSEVMMDIRNCSILIKPKCTSQTAKRTTLSEV
jgi:antitoxin component of MazEF toxin-antitoxin module